MVAGAFGGVSGGAGESGLIYNGVNSAVTAFLPPGNQGSTRPAAYLNYILFDKDFKVLDMGWQLAPNIIFTQQKLSFGTLNIKEPGYVYVYLSYDNDSNNWVYFDDLKVTHTKTNVVQYNEYYPFGLQTNYSWTRENTKNNFLYDAAMELNPTTGWYDLAYRNYDPVLGRFHQVDPMSEKYESLTPYNYAFNDPVTFNDPYGDDPDDQWEWPGLARLRYLDGIGAHWNFSGSDLYDGSGSYYGGYGNFGGAGASGGWYGGVYTGPDSDILYASANTQTYYETLYGYPIDPSDFDEWAFICNTIINGTYPSQGRNLAVNQFNGDYVQIDAEGNVYVPYTNELYWEYLTENAGNDGPGDPDGGPLSKNSGPNWLSTLGSVVSIWGIGTDISVSGPKPVNLGKSDWARQVKVGTKFGRALGVAGLGMTAIDIGVNGPNSSNSLDGFFGGVSFAGPWGAAAGGVYFVGNLLTVGATGKTIGEHVDDNFYIISTGGLPGTPFIMIPK